MRYIIGFNDPGEMPSVGNMRMVENDAEALVEWCKLGYAVMLDDKGREEAEYMRRVLGQYTVNEINSVQHGLALNVQVTGWPVFWIMPIDFDSDVRAVEYYAEEYGEMVIQCRGCLLPEETNRVEVLFSDDLTTIAGGNPILCIGCGTEIKY